MPSRGSIGPSQAPGRSSVDFSRIRKNFQGTETNALCFGVVGHYDQNPAFARIENGKVLVEVTLLPSGDECVAELGQEGQGGGFAMYIPVGIGTRVVCALPSDDENPVIIKRLTDREFPLPAEVAEISAEGPDTGAGTGATAAPQFAFIRVPDGNLLAIETGEDGDIMIRSGANIQIKTDPGQAIHLAGRTHLGAEVASPPTGDFTGESGEITEGQASEAFSPAAHADTAVSTTFEAVPPGTPATGIVRIKDPIQSAAALDPVFWTWLAAVTAALNSIGPIWNASISSGLPIVAAGTPLAFPGTTQPTVIGSRPRSASLHTAEDE